MNVRQLVFVPSNRLVVQILRYGIVGLLAFVVDFALMVGSKELLRLELFIAAAIGFGGGMVANYVLSTVWVFDQRSVRSAKVEFLVFAAIGIAGLALTELILWATTEALGIDYRLAKVLAVVLVLGWNFGMRKYLLFRDK